jgi:hypothetical protein
MVGVITALLTGSAVGLAAAVVFDHSLVAALVSGAAVAIVVLALLMRFQRAAWKRAAASPLPEHEPAATG